MRKIKGRGEWYVKRANINNNTYILLLRPYNEDMDMGDTVTIYVYHDDGDIGEITKTRDLNPETPLVEYKEKAYKYKTKKDADLIKSFDHVVNEKLNEAICKREKKQDREQELRDSINAVIEANKEVHGGLEEELNTADNT